MKPYSKRSIFPQMDNYQETDFEDTLENQSTHQLQGILASIDTNTLLQAQSTQEANQQERLAIEQLQRTLKQVSWQYNRGELGSVEDTCTRVLSKLAKMGSEEKGLNFYRCNFQKWLGMSYLKQFQSNYQIAAGNKMQLLIKAKQCLQYQEPGESTHKKAKRLNNLGLCELFLNQNANSFQCFSKALKIYEEDRGLNILGLLKNIAELYRQWEMYEQAVKIYKEIRSNSALTEHQQHNVALRMLECSNLSENEPNRRDNFHRARDLLDKQDVLCLYFNLKLRLQLIRYSLKWGIAEGDICPSKVEALVKSVESYRPLQPKLKYLQAYCYYIYRDIYAGEDWNKYKEYSEYASQIFQSIYQQ